MSHLTKILEFKKALVDNGVDCPLEQNKLIEQCVIKACVRYLSYCAFRKGFVINSDTKADGTIQFVLNEWNRVHNLRFNLIYTSALRYLNLTRESLITYGCVKLDMEDTVVSNLEDENLCGGEAEALVGYIFNELKEYGKDN